MAAHATGRFERRPLGNWRLVPVLHLHLKPMLCLSTVAPSEGRASRASHEALPKASRLVRICQPRKLASRYDSLGGLMAVWRSLAILMVLAAAGPGLMHSETHHFDPTTYHNTFSFAHEPVLTIHAGDRVVTRTIDARGYDADNERVGERPNPQTGPFYVAEAEPGDMLVVVFERIEPSRGTAWSSSVLAPYTVDPSFLRYEAEREQKTQTWTIDKQRGVAKVASETIQPAGIEVPLRPMLGCVAVAPARKEAVATSTPGAFGGNMDYNGIVAGVKLMLPVNEPGALLFVGDGHARQGDGEVVGNALEVSMHVEFTVDLIKGRTIGWPRLETAEHIMTLGSARPLLQALQHATTELQRWLMADYGFDERGSSLLMGHALEYDIANVVDPHFTVVAKIRKDLLMPGDESP
ncbi:MAG: acetamidase/formamidase family protein [Bryobacterales bacterium]|nr:acetamidase/formamidase family protein [Bryobacterales bacterium]